MIETWSPQQATALDRVAKWLADPRAPQVFRLFGYAGTGKTTLAMHLAAGVRTPMFAAYTGKAASVLRDKGCLGASTLHSLLYNVKDRDRTKLLDLRGKLASISPDHPDYPQLRAETSEEEDRVRRPWFHVNPESNLQFADLLVVDEVSMVDARIGKDILSFGKKVLVLGDPAQLPPIQGGGFFTNATPDILLTEIHRQALDNPILRWATMARKGEIIPYGDEILAHKRRRDTISDDWLATIAGQVLTGKNETRRDLNRRIRKILGRTSVFPVYKDVLVMLMNDHRLGILNGTFGRAQCAAEMEEKAYAETGAAPAFFWLNFLYDGKVLFDRKIDAGPFLGLDVDPQRSYLQVDYGYALTVHKSQGSQWPTVTIYDDGFGKREPETRRRWLYTAITRAEKQLFIVTS